MSNEKKKAANMDLANMPGMRSASTATANMAIITQEATTTIEGMSMASKLANAPQAGMATSMASMRDMCSLEGMQAMCNNDTRILIAVCVALLVLATVSVILRLISRRLSALPFWYDDAVIVLSLILSYGCSALTLVDSFYGVGRHFETVAEASVLLLFKTTVAYQILYIITITLIKVSILLFYHRLFGVRKTFKITVVVVLALVTAWCIGIVFENIFQCYPVQAAWIRPYPHSRCIDSNASLLGTAITNVFLDFTILVLPLAPVWSLALTLRQKTTLTAIFLIGAFICAAAIIRVWAIHNVNQTDVTWSYARPLTWSAVEISVAITCACLPTLQPLLHAIFSASTSRTDNDSVDELNSDADNDTLDPEKDTNAADEAGKPSSRTNAISTPTPSALLPSHTPSHSRAASAASTSRLSTLFTFFHFRSHTPVPFSDHHDQYQQHPQHPQQPSRPNSSPQALIRHTSSNSYNSTFTTTVWACPSPRASTSKNRDTIPPSSSLTPTADSPSGTSPENGTACCSTGSAGGGNGCRALAQHRRDRSGDTVGSILRGFIGREQQQQQSGWGREGMGGIHVTREVELGREGCWGEGV